MANYANLLATIAANIYQNNNYEVTADMVKAAMNAAVASLGAGYQFMGVATPATTPVNTDVKQFYIASEPGTYDDFLDAGSNPLEVNDGEVAILKYDTAWSKEVTGAATAAQVTELVQVVGDPTPFAFPNIGYIKYTDGSVTSSGYHTTDFIPVTQGQMFLVITTGSSSVAALAAYDTNGDYMQASSIIAAGNSVFSYVVPSGVYFIRCCGSDNNERKVIRFNRSPAFLLNDGTIDGQIAELAGAVSLIGSPEFRPFGNIGYIKYSDGAITSSGYHTTDFIPVTQGQVIFAYVYGGSSVAVISAYSSAAENTYIQEKSVQGAGLKIYAYVVPSGVNYVRCCSSDSITKRYASITNMPVAFATEQYVNDAISGFSAVAIQKTIRLYPKTKLPCVSFNFDDCHAKDAEIVTLFKSYGLTCGFAFIASETNITNKAATYVNYQKDGFQILNHSVDATPFTTTNYDYASALDAIMTAKARIEKAGMVCNGFVAPSSTMAAAFIPILGIAHAYAFTTASTTATDNGRQQDVSELHRYSLQSHTLNEIKQYIDDCITNDQIMTFYGHAADLVDGDTSVFSLAKIAAIIEYCITKRDAGLLYVGGTDDCVKYFFDL